MSDPGWILPEETVRPVVQAALVTMQGAAAAGTAGTLIARIYNNVSAQQLGDIATLFAAKTIPVHYGYPHVQKQFPSITMLLGHGQHVQQYVGDEDSEVQRADGTIVAVRVERFAGTLTQYCCSENADEARYLAQFVAFTLSQHRRDLTAVMAYGQEIRIADLEPFQAAGESGRFIFVRTVAVELRFDQHDSGDDSVSTITSVSVEALSETTDGTAPIAP